MGFKSTIFIFGMALIFVLPLAISSPISGAAGVIPICVKAWTGGCDNWKSLRIARYDDHKYSVRDCRDLCSSNKSCAGFFLSTNGSPNGSIKPGTCELYRDGCTKSHWDYWDYYTIKSCNSGYQYYDDKYCRDNGYEYLGYEKTFQDAVTACNKNYDCDCFQVDRSLSGHGYYLWKVMER